MGEDYKISAAKLASSEHYDFSAIPIIVRIWILLWSVWQIISSSYFMPRPLMLVKVICSLGSQSQSAKQTDQRQTAAEETTSFRLMTSSSGSISGVGEQKTRCCRKHYMAVVVYIQSVGSVCWRLFHPTTLATVYNTWSSDRGADSPSRADVQVRVLEHWSRSKRVCQ